MASLLFAIPPLVGYFFVAVLAVTPQTHALRIALWLVVTLFALRAAVLVDLPPSESDQTSHKLALIASMSFIVIRTFEWTFKEEPLVRLMRPAKCSRSTIIDALDLATTLRGYGWDWSRGVYIPAEFRSTSHKGFALHVTLSATLHAFVCGILYRTIRSFSPTGLGAPSGGSIFDENLPFNVRYLRASVISVLASIATYATIQASYDFSTLVAVLVFRQDPVQWPPAFDAPWRATSLIDFWGRRWHQFFRRTFVVVGGYPLSFLLGKAGFVIGAFLASGLLHHAELCLLDGQPGAWISLVGFGMMGTVILVERAFKQVTGRKVGGVVGRIWTMTWLLVFGNLIIDGFARGGVFGQFTFVESVVPAAGQEIVQRFVANFDVWLLRMYT